MPRIDIDFNFTPHPLTGDIPVKTGYSAIEQSVKNIVLTNLYERGFNTKFGTNVKGSMFELFSNLDLLSLKDLITEAIQQWEPDVELVDVLVFNADTDNNAITLAIYFTMYNNPDTQIIQFDLSKLR